MSLLRPRALLLVLLAAAIAPYFIDLNGSSIWDANEAFYVETPREMLQAGDFISPTFNYEPRFNKPVLSYWIVAAFYRVFGVTVGVERVPIALAAMTMIVTAFFLARAATTTAGAVEAALWAGLGLAVTPRLLMFSRRIFIDIYISMFMGLTLLFFALAERFPARRRTFLLLMYVAAGLGVLTKGPIAVALPALVFAAYLTLHGELKRIREMHLAMGILVMALIVVPWYAVLYQRYGWTHITSFIRGENIARYTEGVGVQTSRGAWFYLPVLFSDSFPWSMFLPAAALSWFAARRSVATSPDTDDARAFRARTLLWLWILAIVLFFSFSAAKQDLYIFPIVPAVAALAGLVVGPALDDRDGTTRRSLLATVLVIGVLLAAAGAGAVYVFHTAGKVYALDGAPFVGFVGTAGGLVVLALAAFRRPFAAVLSMLAVLVAMNWVFVLRVLPSFEQYKPVPALSAAIRARATPEDAIVHYNVALPSMVYYLGRHVDMLFDRRSFIDVMRLPHRAFAVLSEDDYRELAPAFGVPTCIIERRPTVNVKMKAVLARDPLPQVLLISNRCQ